MSVIAVSETFEGRGGGTDEDTRVFYVTTNNPLDNAHTILNSGLVPLKGNVHPTNSALFATDSKPSQRGDSQTEWKVTVPYARVDADGPVLAKEAQINPILRRTQVETKTVTTKRGVELSRFIFGGTLSEWEAQKASQTVGDLVPLLTSAREPIEGQEKDESEVIFEVQLNIETWPIWLAQFENSVNSDTVVIRGIPYPKWTLKFGGFHASDLLEQQIVAEIYQYYYQVRFHLHYRRDSWVTPRIDRGYLHLVNGTDEQAEILVKGSKPVVPILLDGAGDVLADPTPETTEYTFWLDDEEKPFSTFIAPLGISAPVPTL